MVNVRLISCALLSLNRRHTCGINPTVVKAPPMNPSSSFQSKVCLLFCTLRQFTYCFLKPISCRPIIPLEAKTITFSTYSWEVFSKENVVNAISANRDILAQGLEHAKKFKKPSYRAVSTNGRP